MTEPRIITTPRQEMMMRNHLTSLLLSLIYGSSLIADSIRLSLETESARWFRGVWISGIVVALGCMFETWEIAFDLRNWWRHRRRTDPLPDNPGSWRYPLAAVGLFLVVSGIVSETIFEVLDANVESQLRSHASNVLSDAESRAATAEGNAAKAQKDLAELQRATLPRNFNPHKVAARVMEFKGVRFMTSAIPDFEASHTAALIAEAPTEAKANSIGSGVTLGSPEEVSRPGVWVAAVTIPQTELGL